MKARSAKRARQERLYLKRRRVWLEDHPLCSRCRTYADEVHHMAGRSGDRLLDESRWLGLCHACHVWVTENPLLAVERGYSLSRVGVA